MWRPDEDGALRINASEVQGKLLLRLAVEDSPGHEAIPVRPTWSGSQHNRRALQLFPISIGDMVAPELGEIGAGVFITLNSVRHMQRIGLGDEVARKGGGLLVRNLPITGMTALVLRVFGPLTVPVGTHHSVCIALIWLISWCAAYRKVLCKPIIGVLDSPRTKILQL